MRRKPSPNSRRRAGLRSLRLAPRSRHGPVLARASERIEGLAAALRARSALARSANDVTGALAPLFVFSGDKTPTPIHTLDYLGRAIVLDVRSGDASRALADTSALRATWDAVRPRVLARSGGPLAAARYERAIVALQSAAGARNDTATTADAKRTLDGVDALEKTFGA